MTTENLLQKDRKEKWKMPTHKTAHLQTAQADTRPKFAKELFSCRHTNRISMIEICQKLEKIPTQRIMKTRFSESLQDTYTNLSQTMVGLDY